MTDSLRDRIAMVLHRQYGPFLGAAERGWNAEPTATQDEYRTDADAVIEALPELTQPVSVEPIGDYQYVCHPCGSSFSFYSSSTMQQFALMHSGGHGSSGEHE
jgi:hypothetical protein